MSDLRGFSTEELLAEVGRRAGASPSSSDDRVRPFVLYSSRWETQHPPIARPAFADNVEHTKTSVLQFSDDATSGNFLSLEAHRVPVADATTFILTLFHIPPQPPYDFPILDEGEIEPEGFGAVVFRSTRWKPLLVYGDDERVRKRFGDKVVPIELPRTLARIVDYPHALDGPRRVWLGVTGFSAVGDSREV